MTKDEQTLFSPGVSPLSFANNRCHRTVNGHYRGQRWTDSSPFKPVEGVRGLTHPNVPEAALPQLPLQGQCFPEHLPGVPPEAHGEGGAVGTGLGQVITQPVIIAY